MKSRLAVFSGRGLWNIWIWIAAGLLFTALSLTNNSGPRSPYWFSEIILYALMLAGMWANAKYNLSKKIPIPRHLAPPAYVFLVWLFGMVYEVSLTVNGQGVGGIHPETLPSFILAQGDYIPIALTSYFIIRKTRASFQDMFFFAGGKSLTEGLIFTGVLTSVLISPMFWLSPLVIAYYTMAYSSFIALPLLLIDEQLLWKDSNQTWRRPILFYWVIGFVFAMAIRIFWGLIYSPIVTQLFRLPPNP